MSSAVMLICAAMVLYFSETCMQAALQAVRVFGNSVLPALFPMLLLSRLARLPKNAERSYIVPQTVLFAWASGSPASTQRVRRLWDAGALKEGAVEPLLCAGGVMSPMFFVGTLAAWTGSRRACRLMLAAHWGGALLTALLWSRLPCRDAERPERLAQEKAVSVPEAIAQTSQSLLAVCGAMMAFSVVAGLAQRLLAPWLGAGRAAVLWALLEIGGGARAVLDAFARPPYALLCALCSFGGLSLLLQNGLFASGMRNPVKLLCMRALHGGLSYGLCRILFGLLDAPAFAHADAVPVNGGLGPVLGLWAVYFCSAGFLKIQNLLMT